MSGWFAMYRAMFDHPIFKGKPDRVAAWAWMLSTAAWKPTKQNADGKIVTVERGQILTSYRQMSEATGVSVKTLRTLVKRLSDGHAIGTDKGTGRLLITICNYDKYQTPPEDRGTDEGTGRAQEGHTKGTREQDTTLEANASSDAEASVPITVSVVTSALWKSGVQYLTSKGVKDSQARSVIGKWRKNSEDIQILQAIESAQKAGTEEPISYITETLKGEPHGKPASKQDERLRAFIAGARGAP